MMNPITVVSRSYENVMNVYTGKYIYIVSVKKDGLQQRGNKMRPMIKRLCVLAFLLASPFAQSKTATSSPQVQKEASVEQDLLSGVITNRTVTVLGWDFYQYFTAIWRAKYDKDRFSFSIHERPTARWGSEIWIQYGQSRVFHVFLPPARSATKEISAQAVDLVYKNIVSINVQRSLYTDIDLAPEEM